MTKDLLIALGVIIPLAYSFYYLNPKNAALVFASTGLLVDIIVREKRINEKIYFYLILAYGLSRFIPSANNDSSDIMAKQVTPNIKPTILQINTVIIGGGGGGARATLQYSPQMIVLSDCTGWCDGSRCKSHCLQ